MKPTNSSNVPKHIAIILDGNRRFSKRLMLKPWKGHEWGAKKVEELLDWIHDFKIKELTLYAFSIDNFNRPKKEFDYLMNIFKNQYIKTIKDPRIKKYGMRINFIGRLYMFPKDVQESMYNLMESTKNNKMFILNIAMAYGGREEVIDAIKSISEKIKTGKFDINDINEKSFSKELYLDADPELIIRTGGEKRTSNFLIWQSNYSEWIFLEKMWPEFEKKDFIECLNEYSKRKRRFGG